MTALLDPGIMGTWALEKELTKMLSVLLDSAQELCLVSVHCPYSPLLLGDTAGGLCTMQYIVLLCC